MNENQIELSLINIQLSNEYLPIETEEINLSDYKIYWNRRSFPLQVKTRDKSQSFGHQQEFNYLNGFLNNIVELNVINKFKDNFTNKLYNLYMAKKLGIKIPSTIITQNRMSLIHFYKKNTMVELLISRLIR